MDNITVCVCDGSVNGIFTAIYKAWEIGTSRTKISIGMNDMELFCNYIYVEADEELAAKVVRTIANKLYGECYEKVMMAVVSDDLERGECIYRLLIKGFKVGPAIINDLTDYHVRRVYELGRRVWKEQHHYLGFVRFREIDNGVLAAKIEPKADILELITEHFSDRLKTENFIILDTKRKRAAIHRMSGDAFITDLTEEELDEYGFEKAGGDEYIDLWNCFFNTIAIEERKNPKLQRNLMPLRYRRYMEIKN
ncbi:MAG: TIGR03915 family putative DNA repair protein [Lachnospiraceae bacterium]|nr:TIGR03915 family putative DNA repair protein [Lachnospiraceae bacterium]